MSPDDIGLGGDSDREVAGSRGQPPEYADICSWLVSRISGQAGISPAEIDLSEPFSNFGLRSQDAVVLSGEMEEWLGRPLPPTLLKFWNRL